MMGKWISVICAASITSTSTITQSRAMPAISQLSSQHNHLSINIHNFHFWSDWSWVVKQRQSEIAKLKRVFVGRKVGLLVFGDFFVVRVWDKAGWSSGNLYSFLPCCAFDSYSALRPLTGFAALCFLKSLCVCKVILSFFFPVWRVIKLCGDKELWAALGSRPFHCSAAHAATWTPRRFFVASGANCGVFQPPRRVYHATQNNSFFTKVIVPGFPACVIGP